jgi:hypothetical protein
MIMAFEAVPQLDGRGVGEVHHLHHAGHQMRPWGALRHFAPSSGSAMGCTCMQEDPDWLTSMLPESKWLLTKMPSPDLAESQLPVVPVTGPSAHLRASCAHRHTTVCACMQPGVGRRGPGAPAHLPTAASHRCGKGGSATACAQHAAITTAANATLHAHAAVNTACAVPIVV